MNENLRNMEFDKILELLSNEAKSHRAKENLKKILPMKNLEKAEKLLVETYEAYNLAVRFSFPPIDRILQIENIIKRVLNGATLLSFEFLIILSTLKCVRKIKEWKNSCGNVDYKVLEKFDAISVNNYLEKKIESVIISENEIGDDASYELFNIRKKIKNINQRIQNRLEKMIKLPNYKKYLTDSVITVRSGRFVIPVKKEQKSKVEGFVHDVSSSGSTLFIEPEGVVNDNNTINELRVLEKKEIEKILFNLTREVEKFSENIISNYKKVIEIDEIFAKASLAIKMDAIKPNLNENGVINLKKARHPLILKEKVKPIDVNLGIDFDTLVITGANTGGKTASIKTIGLMCAMAASGMMIPAKETSEVSVFDEIFTEIGDKQSILGFESTFSSHMKNIVNIVEKTTDKTLVLIDEIGSGTDPEEGASLAIAIIDSLRKKKAKLAVTTHYSELKEYAFSKEGVQCASCEFDAEKLKPTYKILIGSVGSSNAFFISEKLGLSFDIIKRAKDILGSEKMRIRNFFNSFDKKQKELNEKIENIEKLYNQAKIEKENAEKERKKLENECDNILNEARFKAKFILDETKHELEKLLKSISDSKKQMKDLSAENRHKIKEKLNYIENIVDPIENKSKNKNYSNQKFKQGDKVFVISFGKEGIVCSDEDSSGNFMIMIGKLKVRLNKSDLKLCNKEQRISKINTFKRNFDKKVSMEIDLRGKNLVESIQELEIFIDSSFLSRIKKVTIIHGKGSGVLRKGIHDFLKNNKHVKSFRLGEFNEGGTGVTIVCLI